jgi:hypothetical protein
MDILGATVVCPKLCGRIIADDAPADELKQDRRCFQILRGRAGRGKLARIRYAFNKDGVDLAPAANEGTVGEYKAEAYNLRIANQ